MHKDADLAEQFIKQLSHNYRYVLDTREREIVPLEEEIKNVEAYIFLMKMRSVLIHLIQLILHQLLIQ